MKINHSNMCYRLVLLLSIAAFVSSCSSSYDQSAGESDADSSSASDVEATAETNNNPYMIYKLYKVRSKGLFSETRGLEIASEFNKIYAENDVKVVGTWLNSDDPNEVYLITAYRSEGHYEEFVESMNTNDKYQELSRELEEDRESIEAVDLRALETM